MNTSEFGQQGSVVKLYGVAVFWTVAYGLTVATDGLYLFSRYVCFLQQGVRRIGIFARQTIGDELRLMEFVMCGLVQGEQRVFQWLRIRPVMAGDESRIGLREID